MSPIRTARPYAAKAVVEHEFDADHLNVYITFRFSMDQTVKPNNALWICRVDSVTKNITASAWQDAYTLLLTVPNVVVLPDRVTLEYDGPDENLRITWNKQWEPWGAIVSVELPPVYTTRIFSTGPAPQDGVDVSNVNVLFLDCSTNAVIIGGFVGGTKGQVLHICRLCAAANNATLEHDEGGGNQDIFLHAGGDETLTGEYGGWCLACNGSDWYDMSHSKHV